MDRRAQSDKQIKANATKLTKQLKEKKTIYAKCSDGVWVKDILRKPNGLCAWDEWKKL